MKPKQKIEVRKYSEGNFQGSVESAGYKSPYEVVEVIYRVCEAVVIGNFNPVYCMYKNERRLVNSDAGDLSDPFRADDSYLESLYIHQGRE